MSRIATTLALACGLLALAVTSQAQTFASTGTGVLSVAVAPEASISITTATANLTTSTTIFDDYTGTTNFSYKIRTGAATTGKITLQVTSDFGGSGGPKVGAPPSPGDTLSYTCTAASSSMTPNSTLTSASTAAGTTVGTFGAGAHSSKEGDDGAVLWILTNDPAYAVGTYTATVTYTISAT